MIFIVFALGRSGQHAVINWICKQTQPILHLNKCYIKNENVCCKSLHFYNQGASKKISLIYSFEEKNFFWMPALEQHSQYKYIIIVRDAFNLIASRIKTRSDKYLDRRIKVWINHMQYADTDSRRFVFINFNKWFASEKHRKEIAQKLGIKFTDAGLNEIPWHGVSSFDGYKFNGSAQNMDVLNRYKSYLNSKTFKKFATPEIQVLTEKYFNIRLND